MVGGLKTNISITFIVLLGIGLLLGNFVSVVFWQRSLVRTEAIHAENVLDNARVILFNLDPRAGREAGRVPRVDDLCRAIGESCKDVVLFDGGRMQDHGYSGMQETLNQLAADAAASNERILKLEGSIVRMFTGDGRRLLIAEPLNPLANESAAAVFVLDLHSTYEMIMEDQKIILVYLLVNLIVLSVIGLFRMVNLIVRPIDRIVQMTDSYQISDNPFFTDERNPDEFRKLNNALNNMLSRIETDRGRLRDTIDTLEDTNQELVRAQDDVVRAEKLASVGRLSAGFAHEIGNPIGIISGYIELLGTEGLSGEEREQFSTRALAELDRIQRLIRQLLEYAGTSARQYTAIRVDESLFTSALDLVAMQKHGKEIAIEKKVQPDIVISGSREGLQQVLLNCIINAVDAIETRVDASGGHIRIAAEKIAGPGENGGAVAVITISDNGIGIEQDQASTLFDPFFTTKEPGKGTGLGLFVSHAIVEAHGGSMRIKSNEDSGASVAITLPLLDNDER